MNLRNTRVVRKRNQKNLLNCWTVHFQEKPILHWNLLKTALNKNNELKDLLKSGRYDDNLNSSLKSSKIPNSSSKEDLRYKFNNLRSGLSSDTRSEKSRIISKNFIDSPFFRDSSVIALYNSYNDEVDLKPIYLECIKSNKTVLLPRIDGKHLSFHKVESLYKLEKNKFGIPEPQSTADKIRLEEIDIFLLPGLVFDPNGNRIGSGMGYYDRSLKSISSNKLIGICYNFQIVDEVPSFKHDKILNFLISEDGVWDCKSKREVKK